MALTCVNGARECTGCGACGAEEERVCPYCGDWQMEEIFYREGEIIGCSSCIKREVLY